MLIYESLDHKNDVHKKIKKENIHLVALSSLLVNLINVVVMHRVNRNACRKKKKLVAAQEAEESTAQAVSSDQLIVRDGEPSSSDNSDRTLSPANDSRVIYKIDKKEESTYHSQASQDAILITFIHLFFDLALRLSVVASTIMIRFFHYDAFDYYCSFFIAFVMAATVVPMLYRTLLNMRGPTYEFYDLVTDLSDSEAKKLKRNVLEISEGKKRILLINGEAHLKPRVSEEKASEFCRKNGLDKLLWEDRS